MLALGDRLCPNTDEVAAKVMDGEAIMINLSNGIYYSMDGVGGWIWELIEAGHSLAEIVHSVSAKYDVEVAQVSDDLQRLAEELLVEMLVLIAEPTEAGAPVPVEKVATRLPYEPPQLNVYRDMSDLLALDPPSPRLRDINWDGATEADTRR